MIVIKLLEIFATLGISLHVLVLKLEQILGGFLTEKIIEIAAIITANTVLI